MAELLSQELSSTIKQWPMRRKLSLAGVALLSVAIFAVIILQARNADYRLLFANLQDTEASSVISWLTEQKIPYQLKDGGKAILVPADKVYEARLNLAGAGIPQGGGVGFEIFDKQNFGMTDFTQKINYQRALQGELARTISFLDPVVGARVILAIPKKHLLKQDQQEATASVFLRLAPGRKLTDKQIQGVVHLVAGSIDGLEVENVSVIDSNGMVLSRNRSSDSDELITPNRINYQLMVEQRFEKRAQALLDKSLGRDNALVKVTTEIDFSQVEKTEERFDPNGVVPRSEQISEEKTENGITAGGVPGVASNLQDGSAMSPPVSNTSSRTSETINYEINRTVSKEVSPVGKVKSLSVAVLVADRYVPATEDTEATTIPRDAKELKAIEDMVRGALGIDEARGDRIEVVSMPFAAGFESELLPETDAPVSFYQYMPYVKYVLITILAVFLYFVMLRPMVKTMQGTAGIQGQYKTVRELETELSPETELLDVNDPTKEARRQILAAETSPAQVIKLWLNQS
jgi:flagellar M-ring protein FliF